MSRVLRRTPLHRSRLLIRIQDWLFGALVPSRTVKLDARDRLIAKKLALYGEYEPFLLETLVSLADPGSVAVDIGANVGLHTLSIARRVGTEGKVLAFEPDPDNFRILERNLAANNVANVEPLGFLETVESFGYELAVIDADARTTVPESAAAIVERVRSMGASVNIVATPRSLSE